MEEVYLNIDSKGFEKTKEAALKRAKESCGDEGSFYEYPNLKWGVDSIEFDNGALSVDGSTEIGYIGVKLNLDIDIVIKIIEFYMKKLGKLKTVLEATK